MKSSSKQTVVESINSDSILMKERLLDSEEHQVNMSLPKRKLSKILKIIIAVAILAVILIIITALSSGGQSSSPSRVFAQKEKEENVIFDESIGALVFSKNDASEHFIIENYLNIYVPHSVLPLKTTCDEFIDKSKLGNQGTESMEEDWKSGRDTKICLSFENDLKLAVYEDKAGIPCHTVHWVSNNKEADIINCVSIADDNWYGGGSLSIQRWPLNRVNVPLQPYITRKFQADQTDEAKFDSFIEPYFISATGTAILVDSYLPLFVSINHNNDKKLCFKSAYQKPYELYQLNDDNISLKYKVCKDRRGRTAHWHFLDHKVLAHSTVSPAIEMLQKPIWSTRGANADDIKQSQVLALVKNIKDYGLPYSQLFIDGNYSKSSNFFFNENRFPNSHQLIMEFRSDKLHVGTEILPHVPAVKELMDYFIKFKEASNLDSTSPLYLDMFNKQAVSWYTKHLKEVFSELTLKGFRFSGGQASNIIINNAHFDFQSNISFHLNKFTATYAAIASEFGNRCLIGSGYKSQNHTVIADAGPMRASWDHQKGLKSIIPTTLTYGLMGYPFVLAGPIGGINMMNKLSGGQASLPDKELYIRWLQLAVFLPVMELSSDGPWLYGEEVVNYTRKLLEYRQTELWPKYLSLAAREATEVGTPIARPLWFVFPDDQTAQFIDCEFFVSNSLLVAPVLYPNARHRDVYLPEGLWWKDLLHDKYYSGGQWLRQFTVGLYEIATFIQERPPKS